MRVPIVSSVIKLLKRTTTSNMADLGWERRALGVMVTSGNS